MNRSTSAIALFLLLQSQAAGAVDCAALQGQQVVAGTASVIAATVQAQHGYCAVTAKLNDSELKVDIQLPLDGWNGKLVYLGGGGFNGIKPPFSAPVQHLSASLAAERYAVVFSNGGYDGPAYTDPAYFKAAFTDDATKLVDFMFQSVHRALPVGQEVVRSFYGEGAKRSYFEGCSTGGHEAMIEAQRYPNDFDGIVARGPAANFVGLYTQFHRIARHVRAGGALSPAKRTLLANAVLKKCDAMDGVADGILSRAAACDFDSTVLRCTDGTDAADSCLSDKQIAAVQAVTTPMASADGSVRHAGYNFGGEDIAAGWGSYIWPRDAADSDSVQGKFADAFIRAFVTRDPAYDTSGWRADDWLPVLRTINVLFQATDADLSRLAASGGKLIIWNGDMDTSTSPRDNARYYERVVETMGRDKADGVVEMFLAPGVGHCGGGVGPDRVDLLKAVSTWVEEGTAPSRQTLVMEKYDAGKVVMSRPLCKYPAYPRYNGKGDVNAAASFSCALK